MTREEIIDFCEMKSQLEPENEDIFNYIIKALEQEPSGDLISRQAVLNTLDRMDKALDTDRTVESYKELLTECYKDLPSVKQEPKTGHWIVHPKGIYAHLVCNKCLSSAPYDCQTNYCPNCGARMESEDKE